MQKGLLVKRLLVETIEDFLMRDKVEEITVNDIIEGAGVSRTTFYRYFRDKYDLINYIYTNKMNELLRRYDSYKDSYTITYEILKFVSEKREIFLKILSYTGQNSFMDFYVNTWIEEDTKMLKELLGVETLSAEDKYLINYNAIGWSSTMVRWILNGCQEDPKELITILDALTPKKMLHYYREAAFINGQA